MRSAVIDIGSNSMKLLVAEGTNVAPLHEAFAEVRLLDGKGEAVISAEKFSAGIDAVKKLAGIAAEFSPDKLSVVGTSVFRTAVNAKEFSNAVFQSVGVPLRILSGEEEASEIARGVYTDPIVRNLGLPTAIFDLGGGSLEFIGPNARFVKSWPIGAVRLMREFVKHPDMPIPHETLKNIRERVKNLAGTDLDAHTTPETPAVVCGGAIAVAHLIFAQKDGVPPARFSRKIATVRLAMLLEQMAARSSAERLRISGLPASRADIFPVAIAVLLEISEICGFREFIYSSRNLRYGIAAEMSE